MSVFEPTTLLQAIIAMVVFVLLIFVINEWMEEKKNRNILSSGSVYFRIALSVVFFSMYLICIALQSTSLEDWNTGFIYFQF